MRNPIKTRSRKGEKIAAVNTKGRGTKAATTTKTTTTMEEKERRNLIAANKKTSVDKKGESGSRRNARDERHHCL